MNERQWLIYFWLKRHYGADVAYEYHMWLNALGLLEISPSSFVPFADGVPF